MLDFLIWKKMIFWLVLKLETSYRVTISSRILVSFRGSFWRFYFLHGEIFEFSSFFFCLEILFHCKWQGPCYDGWMISMMGQEAIGEICTLWPIVLFREGANKCVVLVMEAKFLLLLIKDYNRKDGPRLYRVCGWTDYYYYYYYYFIFIINNKTIVQQILVISCGNVLHSTDKNQCLCKPIEFWISIWLDVLGFRV
jgi:hypothetical protein